MDLTADINHEGPFKLHFEYLKGYPQTRYEPGQPAECEPYKVTIYGVEIPLDQFITDYGKEYLNERMFEVVEDARQQSEVEQAEYESEQRRDDLFMDLGLYFNPQGSI